MTLKQESFWLLWMVETLVKKAGNRMTTNNRKTHRLTVEKYAYNPFDWYPWGEGAFEKSEKRRQASSHIDWI
jgi:hypothetical protein